MTSPPEPTTQTDPKQRLIDVAEEVFAQKGYEGATVREICDRAGMNIASINYHFGDKERLYREAVRHAHQCTTGLAPMPGWAEGTSPVVKLRDFIQMLARVMNGPVRPSSLQLMMREIANPSPAVEAVVHEYIRPMAHGLKAIIDELQPHLSERQRLMIAFSIVGQCLYYRQNRHISEMLFGKSAVAAIDDEALAEHVTRFTMAALGYGPPYGAGENGS